MGLLFAVKSFFRALGKEEVVKTVEIKNEEPTHLQLLTLLQHSGRLLDFLQEDISGFSDAQVGAAVRQIHEKCRDSLEEFVTVRPVMDEKEGTTITVPQGYDPSEIKIVGHVKGNPPFTGVLRHRGWKAHKISLPKKQSQGKREILAPAEVEVK